MRYAVDYYTLSDCHVSKEIDSPLPREDFIKSLAYEMDESAPYSIYAIGDYKPMTSQPNPAPAQAAAAPAKVTATELSAKIDDLNALVDSMRHDIETLITAVNTMRDGFSHAATATPPAQSGTFAEMEISEIIMTTDDAGKPVYKAKGAPYHKFGVRVWDEVLPVLGIDVSALRPGCNQPPQVIRARVLLATDPESGKTNPRKVIGKA